MGSHASAPRARRFDRRRPLRISILPWARRWRMTAIYADSFQHYAKGNELRRLRVDFDADEMSAFVRQSMELVHRRVLRGPRAAFGAPAPDPIFIVGLPRSGSTLIEQILASHSRVEGTMELPDILTMAAEPWPDNAKRPRNPRYPRVLANLSAEECRDAGRAVHRDTRIQRKTDKPLFIDKMPNNFLHIGLIRLVLPQAKIIDARRHPMACCFSRFKQHFRRGPALHLQPRGPRPVLPRLRRTHGALRSQRFRARCTGSSTSAWSMIPRPKCGVCWRICGLPFEAACLSFYENDRAVRTASSQQVTRAHLSRGDRSLAPL